MYDYTNNNAPGSNKGLIKVIVIFGSIIILMLGVLIFLSIKNGKSDKEPTESSQAATEESSSQAPEESSQASSESSSEASLEESSESSQASEESTEESTISGEETTGEGDILLTYSTGNSWVDGKTKMWGLEMKITNRSDDITGGWKLVVNIKDTVLAQGWDGNYSVEDGSLVVTNAEYNKDIASGESIFVGCNLGTASEFEVTGATINGIPCTIEKGKLDRNDELNKKNEEANNPSSANVSDLLKSNDKAVAGDDWLHTDGNKILDKDGKQVWLTGLNWFGYNTGTNTFDGLWNSKLVPTVKGIADHGFNLIRVPISAELINQWADGEYPTANYNHAYNEELNSMNSLEIFDYFLKLCQDNGIKVMPDIHSAQTDASGHMANLWYTDKVSVDEYYAALEWMAKRYKDNDTIIAFDLKNEPHGKPEEGNKAAIWNDSKDANNWKYVAETAAMKVLAQNPNVLILVEGTEIYPKKAGGDYSSKNSEDYYFNWWGGNLRGVAEYPVNLGKYQDKLVYSPHDYGPTVYEQPWFQGSYTYDSLIKDCWEDNWLYIHEQKKAPLLIGEWGGFMRDPNLQWMSFMRQLIGNYHLNHTFWCLNANSGDTGGLLLDDFTTWDDEKYNFVKQVLWQENGKFVGLDHAIPLGKNGIALSDAAGLK